MNEEEKAKSEDERLLEEAKKRITEHQKALVQQCVNEVGQVLEKYGMRLVIAGDIRDPHVIIIPKI
jgi:hypothetical protein